jgi:hypothetical protein
MRHQISARLSDESYAQLKALSAVLQASQADVIARSFDALEQSLGPAEQRLIALFKKRETSGASSS